MKITRELTSDAALAELGRRLARRRIELGQTQGQLATEAGVAKRTVERLEAGQSAQLSSWLRVIRALGLMPGLDALVPEPAASPIERLAVQRSLRRRVSRAQSPGDKPWEWGDVSRRTTPTGSTKPKR